MTIESATYISDLVSTNPAAGDPKSEGDDHIRLVKSTVKATLPNLTGAMTKTHTVLNALPDTPFGTYTPTAGTLTNVTTCTPSKCQWLRAGSGIVVSGVVTITPTANSASTVFELSLPVASNFTQVMDLSGTCITTTVGTPANVGSGAAIYGSPANHTMVFQLTSGAATAGVAMGYTFIALYEVK